jgi:hypothetical protein
MTPRARFIQFHLGKLEFPHAVRLFGGRRGVGASVTWGVPNIANPKMAQTGTFTVPSDFTSMQGFTFDSRGRILVSGDTSSNKEMLAAIGGSRALGYQGP